MVEGVSIGLVIYLLSFPDARSAIPLALWRAVDIITFQNVSSAIAELTALTNDQFGTYFHSLASGARMTIITHGIEEFEVLLRLPCDPYALRLSGGICIVKIVWDWNLDGGKEVPAGFATPAP